MYYYNTEFHHLLNSEVVCHSSDEEYFIISGDIGSLSSPLAPATNLIIAQLEGLTLSLASYKNITSLVSSMFSLSTGTLEYVGHTIYPLTLYWRCSTNNDILNSIGIYSELSQEGVRMIDAGMRELVIPQINVSNFNLCNCQ